MSFHRDDPSTTIRVTTLADAPAERLAALVAESERDGLGFVRRLVEEWTSGANRFDQPGAALFVASIDGAVVGVCGLNVDPYAARAGVGRVRHLYVLAPYRRRGAGSRYERMGFRRDDR